MVDFAAYYIAFGPHGPRTPENPPGTASKIVAGTFAVLGAAALAYYGFRSLGTAFALWWMGTSIDVKFSSSAASAPPKTLTKEWQEASNERAKEMNLNPISGECTLNLAPNVSLKPFHQVSRQKDTREMVS